MSDLRSRLPLALLLSLSLPVAAEPAPQPAHAQEDMRLLMFHARAKQRRAGGDDPKGAAALYRKVIALCPNSAEAHLRLSESLVESNDLDGAVAPATRATELDPRNAEAWVHLGFIQFLRGQENEKARAACRKALQEASQLLPGDAEVWLRLAQICQALDDPDGALKAWVRLGRLHPPGTIQERPIAVVAWERAVALAVDRKNYNARRESVLALSRVNRPEPRHLQLLDELARDQVDKGYLGHAEESFQLLAQNVFGEPGLWENVARIQMQTERFEDALKSFRIAQAMKDTGRNIYFQAICLMNLGRLPEAEARWKEYFKLPNETPDKELHQNACFCLAVTLLLQNRPAETLHQLDAWPESATVGDFAALKVQALIQTQNGKEARPLLRDGIRQFPKQSFFARAQRMLPEGILDDGLFDNLFSFSGKTSRRLMAVMDQAAMAELWAEFRQWGSALDIILKIRQQPDPVDAELMLLQANAYDQLDRPEDSLRIYREAQKLKPEDPSLQNNLGYLLLEKGGDVNEAAKLIESALKQEPRNGSTLDSWGWAQFKLGKLKEAEETLRKAIELRPFTPEIHKHLGEVLLKLDRKEEALEEWERALAYAFPDRPALEERARKLRVELARQNHTLDTDDPDDPDDEDDNADEDAAGPVEE